MYAWALFVFFCIGASAQTIVWNNGDLGAVATLRGKLSSGADLYDASEPDFIAKSAPPCTASPAGTVGQLRFDPFHRHPIEQSSGSQCSLNKGFNSFFNGVVPGFMILAANEADVVAAVNFARDMKLHTTIRSGLHNLGGLGFVQGGVVIDLRRMRKIHVDEAAATISFEGGIRFGDLDAELWKNHRGWAMANGADGHIGATGAHLGVGTGYLERFIGAGTDQIVAARIVLADGSIVNADSGHELLYAIRGAGTNFGVVTQLTERIHKILDTNQVADLREAKMFIPLAAAKEGLMMVQDMVTTPLTKAEASYTNSPYKEGDTYPDNAQMVPLFYYEVAWEKDAGNVGVYTSYSFWRNEGDTEVELIARSKPWEDRFANIVSTLASKGAYFQMLDIVGAPDPPTSPIAPPAALDPSCTTASPKTGCPDQSTRTFKTWTYQRVQADTALPLQQSWYPHGGFLHQGKFEQVVDLMVNAWKSPPDGSNLAPFFNTALFQWGGANNRRDNSKSAMPSTKANEWLAVMWGAWLPDGNGPPQNVAPQHGYGAIKWVKDLFTACAPYLQYNYIDGTPFDGRSVHTARWTYGESSWNKLAALKAKYDPDNFWSNNVNVQPGPPPSDSSSDGSSGPSASTDLTETDLYAEPSASSHSAPSTKSSHRENLFVVMGVGVLTVLALSAVAVLVRRSLTAQVPPTQGYGAVASTSQGNEML